MFHQSIKIILDFREKTAAGTAISRFLLDTTFDETMFLIAIISLSYEIPIVPAEA